MSGGSHVRANGRAQRHADHQTCGPEHGAPHDESLPLCDGGARTRGLGRVRRDRARRRAFQLGACARKESAP